MYATSNKHNDKKNGVRSLLKNAFFQYPESTSDVRFLISIYSEIFIEVICKRRDSISSGGGERNRKVFYWKEAYVIIIIICSISSSSSFYAEMM